MGSAGGSPRKRLCVRRRHLIRGCEPVYTWARAQANKSGDIRETFGPADTKILCGPGRQLRRKGNREFPSRKCTASPRLGAFHTARRMAAGAGGRGRLQEWRAPGQGRAGQSSRPRLGPGTLRPNGHRRVSAPGPSTCVRVPSVPGRISSPATVLSRHLSARPPLSHPPPPPRPGRRRALTVHLRSGRLAARRPGAPGSGHTLIPPGHRRTSVPGPQPPTGPRGEACAATGRGRLPPSRGPAARLGLVELLALGLQAVARPAAQHPRRHVLDAVHPAAAAKLPSRLRATERVPTSHPSLGTARPRTAPGPPSGEEPSSRPAPRPRPILSPPLAPPRPAGPWPASPAPPPLYPGARHS